MHRTFSQISSLVESAEAAQAAAFEIPRLIAELEAIADRLRSRKSRPAAPAAPAGGEDEEAPPAPAPSPQAPPAPPEAPKDPVADFFSHMPRAKYWRESALNEANGVSQLADRLSSIAASLKSHFQSMGQASATQGGGDALLAALMGGFDRIDKTIGLMHRRATRHNPLKNLRADLTAALRDAAGTKHVDLNDVLYNIAQVTSAAERYAPAGDPGWVSFYPGETGSGARGVAIAASDGAAHRKLAQEAVKSKNTNWRVQLAGGGSAKDDSFYFDISDEGSTTAAAEWLADKSSDPRIAKLAAGRKTFGRKKKPYAGGGQGVGSREADLDASLGPVKAPTPDLPPIPLSGRKVPTIADAGLVDWVDYFLG